MELIVLLTLLFFVYRGQVFVAYYCLIDFLV